VSTYREAIKPRDYYTLKPLKGASSVVHETQGKGTPTPTKSSTAMKKLEELGVTVFEPDMKQVDWDYLAGYEQ
jgi:hypothetical protein